MQGLDLTPEDFMKRFGNRCRELRNKTGLSQLDFSIKHDFNVTQLAQYERGEVDIRLSTIMRLIKSLGVTPSEFFSKGFDK